MLLVLRLLHTTRIYRLYRVITLSSTLRAFCLSFILVIITISAGAASVEDLHLNSCENQDFENTYYMLGSDDISAVTDFLTKHAILAPDADNDFKSYSGNREISTTYYDYDNLEILNKGKELKHILDKNLAKYRKEREQIIYSNFSVSPKDIKSFEVKHYNKTHSPFDKHPLFSLVKRKERPALIHLLSDVSQNSAISISESLKVNSVENVNFIMLYDNQHAVITLSHFTISNFGIANTSFLLKIELLNNKQGILLPKEKRKLHTFLCSIDNRFRLHFPHVKPFLKFSYSEYYNLAISLLPSRAFFRDHPILFSLGQIICLTLIGFLFIYLILGRYSKRANYRKITKQ